MNKKRLSVAALLIILVLAACANDPAAASGLITVPVIVAPAVPADLTLPTTDEVDADVAVSETDIAVVDEAGNTNIDQIALVETLAVNPSGELNEAEIASIIFMREEEKLARDVYIVLFEQWNLPVFQNIANSEQSHTDALLTLITRYGLQDPVNDNGIGIFVNQDLQALYDQLISQGSESLTSALQVGGAIEEIDILDLQESMGTTDNADVLMVYENLLKGSRNHLRAFVSTLVRQSGETYQPVYLSQGDYDAIVSAGIESGTNGKRGGNGNGYGNGMNK